MERSFVHRSWFSRQPLITFETTSYHHQTLTKLQIAKCATSKDQVNAINDHLDLVKGQGKFEDMVDEQTVKLKTFEQEHDQETHYRTD